MRRAYYAYVSRQDHVAPVLIVMGLGFLVKHELPKLHPLGVSA